MFVAQAEPGYSSYWLQQQDNRMPCWIIRFFAASTWSCWIVRVTSSLSLGQCFWWAAVWWSSVTNTYWMLGVMSETSSGAVNALLRLYWLAWKESLIPSTQTETSLKSKNNTQIWYRKSPIQTLLESLLPIQGIIIDQCMVDKNLQHLQLMLLPKHYHPFANHHDTDKERTGVSQCYCVVQNEAPKMKLSQILPQKVAPL